MPDTLVTARFAIADTPLARFIRARLPTRGAIVVAAFLALLFEAAFLAAVYVRSEFLLRPADASLILRTIWWVVGLKLAVFYLRGICHRAWRTARFEDLNRLLRASTMALLMLATLNFFGPQLPAWPGVPRAVLLLDWAFTLLLVGGMQAVARSVYEEVVPTTSVGSQCTVLVVDASPAGRALAESLTRTRTADGKGSYFIAGLLDDDPRHYGLSVGTARVLGPVDVAAACAERLRATDVVVLEGTVFGSRLHALCTSCDRIGVPVRIAEPATAGAAAVVRDVELADLLSRPQARLSDHDTHVHPFLAGKTVLVTGAGGSIGSAICRQLVRFEPSRLLLVERSECALFSIHRELTSPTVAPGVEVEAVLCDITNTERVEGLFAEHRPHIVIHAAAFKHVPLMESHPADAVENNALATAALAECADAHGAEAFVALSTDKAVHPSSVMGASKLVAERFLQSFGSTSATRFAAVRFGNVIGSSGSAVPIFQDQLARRQPITITHQDVRRYFMTINEAAQLVLLAGSLPEGGTYVLEMGSPIRIVDLVSRLAYVMRVPQDEVRIEYCGLRPGEKLDEDLFFEDERHEPTINQLVVRATRPARPLAEVRQWLGELRAAAADRPEAALRTLMDIVTNDCSGLEPVTGQTGRAGQLTEQPA
jgi:FlaA1/EpsC-like NDP-sugar epimerase